MHSGEQPSSNAVHHDPDEADEPILVEAQDFSDDDDDNFGPAEVEDQDDFAYEDDENEDEDEFESDGEEMMSLARVGLHDLNTLRHLYRFGLVNAFACKHPQFR